MRNATAKRLKKVLPDRVARKLYNRLTWREKTELMALIKRHDGEGAAQLLTRYY